MALFTTTNYPVSVLVEDIARGKIGLPDLQRPFVWKDVNVRDLFDSLYRGYPAGFLLFWETGAEEGLRGIGPDNQKAAAQLAIVDGQQRLTSLYAVMKGKEVIRSDFGKKRIQIAFNPLSERFDVADAATSKDHAYISDISALWRPETDLFEIADRYIDVLADTRELSPDQIKSAKSALSKLHNLPGFEFVALTLSATADVETVSDVFVRINGQGKKLNKADFVMTLMSVFWDSGRKELEEFAFQASKPSDKQASPFNPYIKPKPDQLLRVTVGLSLKRARLQTVYSALRGRDANTGVDNPEKREEQFALMQTGQAVALNLTNWSHFLSAINLAGYRSEKMISSQAAIIYSYVLYLIGIKDYRIDRSEMRQAVAEFFFMATMTGRYTSSPETRFEQDLGAIRELPDGPAFLDKLREICRTTLTRDYWTITLPQALATSGPRSPARFAYQASLIKLDALVLYSPMKIGDMVDSSSGGARAALEQHHLFPRSFLKDKGVRDTRKINQIANLALVEWPDNSKISKDAPASYAPPIDAGLSASEREQMYFWHALPPLWWDLPYEDFLIKRRERMAQVIRAAWEQLTGDQPASDGPPPAPADLINDGEGEVTEFKSTLRTNLHTGGVDEKMHLAALKTIGGFLNTRGGTLIVGVADDGEAVGLDADKFPNEDKMGLHLINLVRDRIGDIFLPYVHAHFEDYEDERILVIRCEKGPKAAFVKDGEHQRFFVRAINGTTELRGNSVTEYTSTRFR